MAKEFEFYRRKLDNGLTILLEKRETPVSVVSVSTSVCFGAQYESEDIKGISHFIEHLVFKGTKNRTFNQIAREIEIKGGTIDATTCDPITYFSNKLPKKYFSVGADVSRDLVLNPLFEKNELEKERKVILEEIKTDHDNPGAYVIDKIKELLYEKPFGLPIFGTEKTVSSLSREKIIEVFNSVYTTDNIIFTVVGDVSLEGIVKEGKKFPKTNKKINFIPIIKKNNELIEKRNGINQASVAIGFHMPTYKDKNRYAADIFNCILGDGMMSTLFQEIREKRGLCYSIQSALEQSKDYGHEIIYAGTPKEKVSELKELVLKEVKKMQNLKKSYFEEAKERLIGSDKIDQEDSNLTMLQLISEEIAGNAEEHYKFEERINSVKLEDVQNLGKLKGYSFVALLPE
jgi:predicted Zn-dependent peptidase